ncbi:hypothetical protein [Anaerosporobacter faecicola]|uniref:hypothetical protein n=1 Tax=Anaerosporobacter faecicola TaxID=2718714 RepID=UPI00143A4E22|nr:hypothetical protein [Anaerosporobacter faecicola]
MDKGKHGYIPYKKKKQLCHTFILAAIAAAIFIAGYLLNDNSRNNVFTILAVLMVLPGAKMLVGYIVVAPYHTMEEKRYADVCKATPEGVILVSDLVLTSPDKVMNLDCAAIDDRHVIALLGKEGQDTSYIQTYLSRTLKNQGYSCEVKVMTDFSKYIHRVKTLTTNTAKEAEAMTESQEDSINQDMDKEQITENQEIVQKEEIKKLLLTLNV